MEATHTQADRQRWLSVLAQAPVERLREHLPRIPNPPSWRRLRATETGLTMVPARIGGSGAPFNFAEMTVTRAAIRTEDGRAGLAYVAGRSAEHAELAALFDALLQDPARRDELERQVIGPLQELAEAADRQRAAEAAATGVIFETMVRGDA